MHVVLATVCLLLPLQQVGQARASAQEKPEVAAAAQQDENRVVKASWWGFDPADSTLALQTAIDSGARKVIVENVGRPWVVTPIQLASNQELYFEPGVEIVARRGAFKGANDCLFSATLKENVILRGYGANLRMWRDDYASSAYIKAEWRHVLQFKSCANVRVLGLILSEGGGDGIYLGTAKRGITNRNVVIKDVVCDRNYRQGISVISAQDLLIEGAQLTNTGGTPPGAGIDFEPNNSDEMIKDCVVRNCVVSNNRGDGVVVGLGNLDANSVPVSLRVENCTSTGNGGQAAHLATGNPPARAVSGRVMLTNCRLQGGRQAGFRMDDNPPSGLHVLLEKCSISAGAQGQPTQSPIVLSVSPAATQDVGGITFVDCGVRAMSERSPISLIRGVRQLLKDIRADGIEGNLDLLEGEETRTIRLTRAQLAEWIPMR
jgi:hypothetical protein